MPPLTLPQKTALVAAVAGAVVGVSTLMWSTVRLRWYLHDQQASEDADVPPESWTKAQVAAWLRDNGVSKSTTALCLRFNLNGKALLQVTERHLYRMGVPLRDARVLLAAVADLKEGPAIFTRISQPPSSRQPSLASASLPPSPAQAVHITAASAGERFEAAWQALVRTCVLQSDNVSPAEQQQRVVVYTSALLESFQALLPHEQATALALVAAAEDSSATSRLRLPPAPPRAPTAPPKGAAAGNPAAVTDAFGAVEKKLQPLHAMVDGFLEFLQSPELDAVSADDFEELGARVAGQVKRVAQVCEQLPAEMGGPLLHKCEKIFEELTRRQSRVAAATPAKGASTTNQKTNSTAILQGVMDLVMAIKDPALLQLPPAQRVKALASLMQRAEAIEALAAGAVEDVPRDEQVLKLVQPVIQFLREVERAATEAAAVDGEESKADCGKTDEEEEEDGEEAEKKEDGGQGMTNADVPIIISTIQKIQETLQSAEFQHAPPKVRTQLCTVLTQRISVIEDRTDDLPTPTRRAVQELLQNTKSVLAAVGNAAIEVSAHNAAEQDEKSVTTGAAAEGDDDAAKVEAVHAEDVKNEESNEAETEEENADGASVSAVGVERYVEQLEKIFEFLTSEALEHAPASERKKMSAELMQRVDKIRNEIAGSPTEGSIVSELIEPLYNLLKNMATTQAPSKQFLNITAPLRDVQQLLSSAMFKEIPHTEKVRIARGIVPQLQQLTAAFGTLPSSERAAAEEMVRPISEDLLRILQERNKDGVTPQSVLDRLQAIMRTIQGSEFAAMSSAVRGTWAANAIAELQRLNDDCMSLGPEGDALQPIVQRLETQLRGLCGADSTEQQMRQGDASAAPAKAASANTASGGTPAQQPQSEGEGSLWDTVRAMQAELAQADNTDAFVSPTRLQEMLSVLGAAAEATDMTEAQESLLQAFGEALRTHVEAATAVPDDNNSEGDDDDDALDSLRVSLQTLLDVAREDGGASGVELSSIAAKTEELIAMADKAGVKWREDAQCGGAIRGILEVLQQTSATSGDATRGVTATSASTAAAPSKVEEVLQSSIQALAAAPPTSKEDFAPFMRVLQLAQPAAEQMTNRELVLLKRLQEAVIEAMHRLPEPPHPIGEVGVGGAAVPDHGDDQGSQKDGKGEDKCDVDAVLDALLDMSTKLRDGSYTAVQLDEFEAIQHDLEDLITSTGVDLTEAMAPVREQIQLQRNALRHAQGGGVNNEGEKEGETSPLGAAAETLGKGTEEAPGRESTDAFNEDDEEEAANDEGGDGEQDATKP